MLDVGSSHETGKQIGFALVEDFVEDEGKRVSNFIFCHGWALDASERETCAISVQSS